MKRLLHLFLALTLALCGLPVRAQKFSELTVETTAVTGDRIPFLDVSATAVKTITLGNLSLVITPTWSNIASKPTTLSGFGITDGQPLDSDLTSIAALTTTTFGRSLLTQADAAAARTTLGAGTGSGTVTTLSVTTANGVSGSVANATSTPAITLSLGAITPSSVAQAGGSGALVSLSPASGNAYFLANNASGSPRASLGWESSGDIGFLANAAGYLVTWTAGSNPPVSFISSGTTNFAGAVTIGSVAVPTISSTNTLTNKTISGASNTLTSIGNSSLTNSSITIGGAATSLGGSVTTTTLLDSISSTRGAVLYRGASGWAALTPGTSGYFLKSNGSGADPSYAAASGGGGSSIDLGSVPAFVAQTGNDGTGVVGDLAHPFASIQAAYTAGARVFYLYPRDDAGDYGNLTAGTGTIAFIGSDPTRCRVANLTMTGALTIYCNHLVAIDAILGIGANGNPGNYDDPEATVSATSGMDGVPAVIHGGLVADITMYGGNGGAAGGGGSGGNGGSGATLTLDQTTVTGTIAMGKGLGADGGSDGTDGVIYATFSTITTFPSDLPSYSVFGCMVEGIFYGQY